MLDQPFLQITLPLMVTFVATMWAASWLQNKRFDDFKEYFKDINKKLDKIDEKLEKLDERIRNLELMKWR